MTGRRPPLEDHRLLGELLVEAGIATRRAVASGLEEQRLRGGRLGYNLLKLGLATPAALHLFLSENLDALMPGLADGLRTQPAIDLIPARLAHHYGMVPVGVRDGVLCLGLGGADNPALIPAVEELTGLAVEPMICPPSMIADVLARCYPSEVERGVLYRAGADHQLILSDRRRRILPALPEILSADAPAAERLRSIAADAVRRRARRVRIEPERSAMRVLFEGRGDGPHESRQPRGAYPALALLLEGLSGLSARGRVVPRQGRFLALVDGRRIAVSVSVVPGLEGDTYHLDLREEKVRAPSRQEIQDELPALARSIDRLAEEGRGLIVVAGSDPLDIAAGVSCVLSLLGDRRTGRVALGDLAAGPMLSTIEMPHDEEEIAFDAFLERAVTQAPDLLVLHDLLLPARAAAAAEQAERRIAIAGVAAIDACAALETMERRDVAARLRRSLCGVLGVRLMERLCEDCRRRIDLFEVMSPAPRYRQPPPGSYFVADGCASCRGSGLLQLLPVLEFLDRDDAFPTRPDGAAALRRDGASRGRRTLFGASLGKASLGLVDVREAVRLLLHEC